MCYPKPGPRCASHAKKNLKKATTAFIEAKKHGSEQDIKVTRRQFLNAQIDYDSTPEGQKLIKEEIAKQEENLGTINFTLEARLEAGQKRRVEAEEAYANAYHKQEMPFGKGFKYINEKGEFHRLNGPAIEHHNGVKEWYKNGKLHREDGPAIETPGIRQEWYKNGKLHRDPEKGPAVITVLNDKEYYKNGELIKRESYNGNTMYYDKDGKFHKTDGPALVTESRDYYYKHGKLHRTDGPAIYDYQHNKEEWYQNGELHRENGPAIYQEGGDTEYFKNGERHRDNGPAIITNDGDEEYYKNGELHRDNGPAVIRYLGEPNEELHYYKNGLPHREDGPAVIRFRGTPNEESRYYKNGELHREDGPAITYPNGGQKLLYQNLWYKNGERVIPSQSDFE